MKLICKDKVIDLNKFETVRCLPLSREYLVEAITISTHFLTFDKKITVCSLKDREQAETLVKDIATKWSEGNIAFDVEEWLKNHRE